MKHTVDVAIVGGGLAGLTLALQLSRRRNDLHVMVIDRGRRPAPERTSTVGESFAELGSHYLRDVVGLADHLDSRQLPKFGLRFFVGDQEDLADRFELGVLGTDLCTVENGRLAGLPLRTHQVDRGRLENELAVRCVASGVELRSGTSVERTELGPDRHVLRLSGDEGGVVEARWVVFATGVDGPGDRPAWRSLNHRATAVWLRVEGDLDVGSWSDRPEFLARTPPSFRRLSTNHLLGRGYWMWVIPLPTGVTSVGVVADPDVVDLSPRSYPDLLEWIEPRDARLAAELAATRPADERLHTASLEAGVAPKCFSGDRWAVVGQSAAFVDVLYSPGADLIALGNTLVSDLVERDLDDGRIAGRCAIADRVFQGLAEGFAEIYRGHYANFGTREVVGTKVLWDSALYFGFNTMLFRHGLSGDPAFLSRIQPELLTVRSLQARIQGRLRRGDIVPMVPGGDATVEWGSVEWMMDAYRGAEAQPDEEHVLRQLRAVLSTLERVGRRIEGNA